MRDLKKEVFKVIFLDKKNAVIEVEDLFEGTVDKSAIYPREIVKKAIEHNASGIIIVHNHPSGNIQPSPEDEKITQQLLKATNMLQIRMLDHIIIGDNKYYSFADTGEIEIWNE
ncbi:MAG: DNA repair protein RadC, partial [Candidatus Cloacimonadota bacterium]|nr:DNA repair protein RadC [Candidatus Cloacimonadota bacterium]